MGITVEFKDFNEMVAFAIQLTGTVPAAQIIKGNKAAVEKVNKVVEPEKVEVPEEKELPSNSLSGMINAPDGITAEEKDSAEKQSAKTFTLEEVRAALAVLTRAGKQKQVKDLLTSFGAKNLSSVKAEDYAVLMEKAGAL